MPQWPGFWEGSAVRAGMRPTRRPPDPTPWLLGVVRAHVAVAIEREKAREGASEHIIKPN